MDIILTDIGILAHRYLYSMNNVLVAVSDSNYIRYFLPLIESAKEKGKWDGDFCLIINDDTNNEYTTMIEEKGIHIFRPSALPVSYTHLTLPTSG